MRAVGQPDRAGGARDFLHGDAMLEIAEPEPAELLLDRDAMHAELAELAATDRAGTCCCGRSRRRAARSCAAAKPRTLSRSMSAVSPSPKLKPPRPPASMGGLRESDGRNVLRCRPAKAPDRCDGTSAHPMRERAYLRGVADAPWSRVARASDDEAPAAACRRWDLGQERVRSLSARNAATESRRRRFI